MKSAGIKPAGWVGLVIILSALIFGAKSFVTNLTPYLPFADARKATGQVQVMGSLDKSSIVTGAHEIAFTIVAADGDRMPVRFTRAVPATFSMATQVTAIGKFDGQNFQADNLLVKCPSKYQGKDGAPRSYSSSGA